MIVLVASGGNAGHATTFSVVMPAAAVLSAAEAARATEAASADRANSSEDHQRSRRSHCDQKCEASTSSARQRAETQDRVYPEHQSKQHPPPITIIPETG